MTREQAFEEYLEPDDKQQSNKTFREKQFANWLACGTCANWEECERRWQAKGLDKPPKLQSAPTRPEVRRRKAR